MAPSSTLLAAAVPLLLWYCYSLATRWRFGGKRDGVVYAPRSLLFGSGKLISDLYRARGDTRLHTDYIFRDLVESLGSPPIVVLDFRPFLYEIAIINSHEVAEQIAKSSKTFPHSVPKSPTMDHMLPLIGEHSVLRTGGETWKGLRRTFNPGFAPTHLATLLPRIVEKTSIFVKNLDKLARSGKPSALHDLCVNLTFDIIGAVTMDIDLNAQLEIAQQSPLVRYYRELMETYTVSGGSALFQADPLKSWRRKQLTRGVETELRAIILAQHAESLTNASAPDQNGTTTTTSSSSSKDPKARPRSVLALSLQEANTATLSPHILQTTTDTLKSFLFAGHDTTSILLQWSFYELSRTPHALRSLRCELATVFGANSTSDTIAAALSSPSGPDLIKRLTYTSAIIKETLRVYPPASTARRAPPGTGFTVRLPGGGGGAVCLDGFVLYNCHYLVQRDRAVHGEDADEWVPERWVGDADTSAGTRVDDVLDDDQKAAIAAAGGKRVPASAWRPFERGPRNCIGQELANLEARVILAVTAWRYDFVKVGAGAVRMDVQGNPVLGAKGQYEVVSPMFNTRQVTSKPFDGMEMLVKFNETQA
ncbi:cytochrome P450 monooxygenase [Macrophomina phaseolina]|uniref:Cytochrome P450 monooxygenase n=1 Tax=Macrophomina phaseolina TaxID=35725 RepID=A0ABQ8GM12_9PEZI|nr:cytochrome P450 monooxygenase [Macrophomina phaseolina]